MHVLPSSAKGRTKGSAKRGAKGSAKRNAKRSNLTQKDDFAFVLCKRGFVLSTSFFIVTFRFPIFFCLLFISTRPRRTCAPHLLPVSLFVSFRSPVSHLSRNRRAGFVSGVVQYLFIPKTARCRAYLLHRERDAKTLKRNIFQRKEKKKGSSS